MENTPYLRRQAAYCLRLSQFCSNDPAAERFSAMAAEFHAQALRAEFQAQFASDSSADPDG